MKKVLLFIGAFILCLGINLHAQERTVTGKVVDDQGETLPGVSVLLKGTSTGVVTDLDGMYSISVSGDGGVLVFSFIGMQSQEVTVGSRTSIDVTLAADVQQLSEVVVTALGITREKASLGYAVAKVSSDMLENRPEADIGRILRGKAPGVDITQTSGLSGTGTNIVIRGYSSITGSNQPLFVVDGVPFNSSTNSDRDYVSGGATASSRFLDLDPNNVAEISVLKGLSATVLYGEAGRNGVILVTTKTGSSQRSQKGSEVSFSQSVSLSEVANLPDYQDTYGNGFGGDFGWYFSNWGPAFDVRGSNGIAADGTIPHPYDQSRYNAAFPEYKGVRYDYKPYKSVENFFRKGVISNTSVGVSKNLGENSSASFNYSYMDDKGFIPADKNTFKRHNLALGTSTKLENGLTISSSFNYVESSKTSPPAAAGAGSNPSGASLFANLIYTPRSMDLMNLPYQNPIDGSQVYYRRGSAITNPLWVLHNNTDYDDVTRYWSAVNVKYDFNDWLNVTYRASTDQFTQTQSRQINKGGSQVPDGYMQSSTRVNKIGDHNISLNFDYDISSDVNLSGRVGANLRRETRETKWVESTQQFVFGLFSHQNFKNHTSFQDNYEVITNGVYFEGLFSYKNYLYATILGRNDWNSALETENSTVFYPSASVSFLAKDALPFLESVDQLNLLKLRLGYGTSAGFPPPYSTRSVLTTEIQPTLTRDGQSVPINSVNNRLGNPNLKPELIKEFEVGLEARILDKIGIDFSYYNKVSDDLIIDLRLDPSTGYTITRVNGASVSNKGVELGVTFSPVQTADFSWDISANYTKNVNLVETIADGVDQIQVAGGFGAGNWAIAGERYGVIRGDYYERVPDGPYKGQYVVDATGNYITAPSLGVVGDPNPDWTGNINNTVSWKGLSFSMLWSYVKGGDIFSYTTATLLARGVTTDTDFDRFIPVILPGAKKDDNGNYVPNDNQAYFGDLSFNQYFWASEGGIFDGTRIRLQELSLAYQIPKSLLSKTPFGSANVSLFGQNLWYNAPNFPKGVNYDPDVVSTGVGNGRGLEYITGPTVKKYGVTLNLTF